MGYEIAVTDRGSVGIGYDCIWALAIALEAAEANLSRSLDSYQYGDEEYALAVGRGIQGVTFAGMSVRSNKDKTHQ